MSRAKSIYREQSLRRLSSPDQLDELLRIVRPQAWIALVAVALGLGLVLAWSLLGRIPASAQGSAVLVRPKQVVPFQSTAAGTIRSIEVAVGEEVQPGALLARLRLPVLEKQLEQERLRLEQFRDRSSKMTKLERDLAVQERAFLEVQRGLLGERIESVRAAAERYQEKAELYLGQQRASLATSRARADELQAALEARYDARHDLWEDGNLTVDQLLEARTKVIDNELRRAELAVTEYELELRELSARESYDEQMDLVQDLTVRVNDLELREMQVSRRLLEDELESASDEQGIRRTIEELEAQLDAEGRVVYDGGFPGRVLEITTSVGQHVDVGNRIGKLEIEDPAASLMALAYFQVRDGKKVRPGQRIRVAPSTVERERHGAILGRVERVSDYPVTTEAAANQIGDLELARSLLQGRNTIEVLVSLELDEATPTGFAWTSGAGPREVPITAGTTGEARATIEERRPITLVLPFLRSATGL